jgi:hypothetical protein
MATEGVSPDFVRALCELDLGGFDSKTLVQLAIEGVSPAMIRELATL